MTKSICVRLLPAFIQPNDTQGKCVVMTDVLRASTTIIQATAGGVTAVHPVAEIEDALKLRDQLPEGTLIGGERGGEIVPGFNCGNSPREYTTETVTGKALVLCTSNGTYTLDFCRGADRILIGAFANLSAVSDELLKHEHCLVACAGTNRKLTGEDILFAGAVVDQLLIKNPEIELDTGAQIAWAFWNSSVSRIDSGTTSLAEIFAGECVGGVNLIKLGYDADVEFCAQIDRTPIVPELNEKLWSITLSKTDEA